MKKAMLLVFPLIVVIFVQELGAQAASGKESSAYAEIVFFEGTDLLILRSNGKVDNGEPLGQKLLIGDQVQTGARTSVELVLLPRRSRIRLSENTAVTIRDLGGDGSTGLELLYGRLRSKVTKLASGNAPYQVSSQSCVAGVRGTDFGCDVLVARSGAPAPTRVYCFEGSVEIDPSLAAKVQADVTPAAGTPKVDAANSAPKKPVIISAGGMALVEAATADKAALVIEKPIEAELRAYWKANDFTKAEPVAAEALPPQPSAPAVDWGPIRAKLAAKNSAIIGASTFILIGAGIETASFLLRGSDSSRADELLNVGALWAACGIPILVVSFTIDPLKGIVAR
jgi:hypothetical protein